MHQLYADEQFPRPVVLLLRQQGYDVLTVQDADMDNQNIPDAQVVQFATLQGRAVITENRRDFIRLHKEDNQHAGIIVCKKRPDWDWATYASAIDSVLSQLDSLKKELVRMNQRYSSNSQ